MRVEIVYAEGGSENDQSLVAVDLSQGAVVIDAIRQSGLIKRFSLSLTTEKLALADGTGLSVGIFSQPVKMDRFLQEGDRIEIYRPLLIDPKQARLLRANRSVH